MHEHSGGRKRNKWRTVNHGANYEGEVGSLADTLRQTDAEQLTVNCEKIAFEQEKIPSERDERAKDPEESREERNLQREF